MQNVLTVLTNNRFKSFYWRTAMMALAGFITLVIENLAGFGLSAQTTVILGLILGELSKAVAKAAQ